MKTMYLECNMGAAGDMLMAALLELHPNPDDVVCRLNRLGLPGVSVRRERSTKCGVVGTHVSVSVNGMEERSVDVAAGVSACADVGYSDGAGVVAAVGHASDAEKEHVHTSGAGHEHGRAGGTEHDHGHAGGAGHDHGHADGPGRDHGHAAQEREHALAHAHGHEHGSAHAGVAGHSHAGMADISALISSLPIPERAKTDALAVYGLIAEAEGKAHGKPAGEVHFHEVGAMDAVADIVGTCLLMGELAPERIVASPVHVGSGQVRCAHGVLPVPAPATASILTGVPTYGGQIRGELCTPTGAALLKHYADAFGDRPLMTVEAIGYGMGKKDFPAANCLRAFIGESAEFGRPPCAAAGVPADMAASHAAANGVSADMAVSHAAAKGMGSACPVADSGQAVEVACNLDDMTGEDISFAMQALLDGGALDAWVSPVLMKKGRPGSMLACLCRPEDEGRMARLMLKHTTSFGVRCREWRRHTLDRAVQAMETELGQVRIKTGSGHGVSKSKPEYEDVARHAVRNGMSVTEARRAIKL